MIRQLIEWHRHLFWLIGWGFWCLIQLDFDSLIDTMFWLKIHLTCRAQSVGRFDVGRKQKAINFFVISAGFIVYCLLLLAIINLFLMVKKLVQN